MAEKFYSAGLVNHYYNVEGATVRAWRVEWWKYNVNDYVESRNSHYVAFHYCVRINGYVPPEMKSFAGLALKASASIPPTETPSIRD